MQETVYPKADLAKRILALIIDILISGVFGIVPKVGWIVGMAYMLFRDGFEWNFMKNRSLGKVVMKLKVVVLEGEKVAPDYIISLKRNWLFIIPVISFFAFIVEGIKTIVDPEGKRFGDILANTMVVDENVELRDRVIDAEVIHS